MGLPDPFSVLVVDDHEMFADSLRYLLMQRVNSLNFQQSGNAEEALTVVADGDELDVILLDLNLPGISGLTLLQKLRDNGVWTPVLVVSASGTMTDIGHAISNGASGYISKTASARELFTAIETVVSGNSYHPSDDNNTIKSGSNRYHPPGSRITQRQREVLHLVSQGYSNQRIADALGISPHTVKAHMHEIFGLLGVTNRTSCVRKAEELGLL